MRKDRASQLELRDFDVRTVDELEILRRRSPRNQEIRPPATRIARKQGDEQAEKDHQERGEQHRDCQEVRKFIARTHDGAHHDGEKKDDDVGLEIAGADGAGIGGAQPAEIVGRFLRHVQSAGSPIDDPRSPARFPRQIL